MLHWRVPIAKLSADDKERIEKLGLRLEARFRAAFKNYVENVLSEDILDEVVALLKQRRINDVLAYFDQFAEQFGIEFQDSFREAAKSEIEAKTPEVMAAVRLVQPDTTPTRTVVTFGGGNAPAEIEARAHGAQLVKEIADSTREVVTDVIRQGLTDGSAPRDYARDLREKIGLTASQNAAVDNYERLLRAGSKEALTRGLRDKRSDGPVMRAAEGGKPLSEDQITRMVKAYRAKYLKYRTENIARTEGLRASTMGRRAGMRATIEQLGLSVADVEKTWQTSIDGRERSSHRLMHRQKVRGLDGSFKSPRGATLRFPRDPEAPAAETVQCRCIETYAINPAD